MAVRIEKLAERLQCVKLPQESYNLQPKMIFEKSNLAKES